MTVKTERVDVCIFCRTSGRVLYPHVRDDLYGHEGDFAELICSTCGLIWLSPRPVREDMGKYYAHYYTHVSAADSTPPDAQPRFLGGLRDAIRAMIFCGYYGYTHLHSHHMLCALGKTLGRLRWMRVRATNELKERIPRYKKDGLLLDIGCGGGDFLCAMKRLGWNVLGVESDPEASAVAQRRGLRVYSGPFEEVAIPGESVDHITMNHVIEHVYDPIAVMDKCYRILKPGGTVVLYAPNSRSLGHKRFQRYWLPLDPPRHLYCYFTANMRMLLERCGFTSIRLWTSPRLALGVYDASVMLQKGIVMGTQTAPRQRGRLWLSVREQAYCAVGLPSGEEIVATATKPSVALRGTQGATASLTDGRHANDPNCHR
jgi:SAM-dependent methyltransferase